MTPTRTELEGRLTIAKLLARKFWHALKLRYPALDEEALFSTEAMRIVDPVFDAAEAIWERHQITVVPCRQILDRLDERETFHSSQAGPSQPEMYLGLWPDGSSRNLSRGQVLMMGGQDETS